MGAKMNKPQFWIKNINDKDTNGKSKGNSYMRTKKKFVLHFHEHHETNANNLKKGDVILLFQKNSKEERIFTHLVTPINNNNAYPKYPHRWHDNTKALVYCRKVEIIKKKTTSILSTKFWINIKFQGICFGNACEIENISAVKNGKISFNNLINEIWNIFGVNNNIRRKFP